MLPLNPRTLESPSLHQPSVTAVVPPNRLTMMSPSTLRPSMTAVLSLTAVLHNVSPFTNRTSLTAVLPMNPAPILSPSFRCNICIRDAPLSLQKDVRRMNEHRKRIHDAHRLTPDEFLLLETCKATKHSKHSKHSSYCDVVPTVEQDDFRHESLFEMRVGLLKFSTVFYEGEASAITMDCKRFFNQARSNPFFEATVRITFHGM